MGSRKDYDSIPDKEGGSSPKPRFSRRTTIIIAVCVLLVLLLPLLYRTFWHISCLAGIKISGFDFLDTSNYDKWYTPDSTMQLAQSGTFHGPSQMTEYVDFTKSKYFSYYNRVEVDTKMLTANKDQCVLLTAVQNKAQVKPEYSKSGEGECMITTVGFKLNYKVNMFGFGFKIHRTELFYPAKFLVKLFKDLIGGDGVTDYICNTVLRDKCNTTYLENGLDEETCKTMYNDLREVDNYGYLDDYAKGCRILHSAFAEINDKHCPHMSFKPIKDYTGSLWCQDPSGGVKAEDLFTDEDLAFIEKFANKSGFDPITLSTPCAYDPNL